MSLNKYSSIKKEKNINNIKKPLLNIRKKIDIIDNKVHDLLMLRADLVLDVIKLKRKESTINEVIYRPAREHEILIRLIKRHKGEISIKALISIWRNIISTYISIQGEFKVTFSGNIEEEVKNYFSSDIKLIKSKSSLISLKNIDSNKVDIAILPFPNKFNDWWSKLDRFKGIFIIGGLLDSKSLSPKALMLSKQEIEYSANNSALYTLKIDTKNIKKYSQFLSHKGYTFIAKKIKTSSKSIILFSTKVFSELDHKNKLITLKNFELDKSLEPNYIGAFAFVDKAVLNEKI
jgi:chorismate mutase